MTTTSTHTVTVKWNDNVPGLTTKPDGSIVVDHGDTESLTWPNGWTDNYSSTSLKLRGITPPRSFKPGDWVRFQNDGREWSTGAYQITTLGTDGRHRLNGLHGAWFPDRLLFVAEGEVPE